jgi:hypothetical protein
MPSTKIQSFDANSLALIEDLCNSTWDIFELRYPFRDLNKDEETRQILRLKLFILAEDSGLADPYELQQRALDALSRRMDDYYGA